TDGQRRLLSRESATVPRAAEGRGGARRHHAAADVDSRVRGPGRGDRGARTPGRVDGRFALRGSGAAASRPVETIRAHHAPLQKSIICLVNSCIIALCWRCISASHRPRAEHAAELAALSHKLISGFFLNMASYIWAPSGKQRERSMRRGPVALSNAGALRTISRVMASTKMRHGRPTSPCRFAGPSFSARGAERVGVRSGANAAPTVPFGK